MDSGNGGNPWFYNSLQAPSWDVHDYDELNSTGPLLPLLQQYLDAGTVFFIKRKIRENKCSMIVNKNEMLNMDQCKKQGHWVEAHIPDVHG